MEPDQIDMMNEKELRLELRKLVKENIALRAKHTAHNSDYSAVLKKRIKDTGFFFEEQELDFLVSLIDNLNTAYFV